MAKYDTLEEAIAFARAQGGGGAGDGGEEEGGDGEKDAETEKVSSGFIFYWGGVIYSNRNVPLPLQGLKEVAMRGNRDVVESRNAIT